MRVIELESWTRREHIRHYGGMEFPHISICVQVDITDLWVNRARTDASPTVALVYVVTKAANRVPEMRQRIRAQRIVRVGFTGRIKEAHAWLAGRPDVARVEPVTDNGEGDLQVTFAGDDEVLTRLLSELVSAGFPVLSFQEETGDLEDVFMRLTEGIVS